MEQTHQPTVSRNYSEFFRKRHNGTAFFTIGLLLFLLPFAEYKCGTIAFAGNTGIGIATGQNWKMASSFGNTDWMKKLNESKKNSNDMMKEDPNIFAIVSLAAGLFGAGIAFSGFGWRSMAGMCAGVMAAVMLLAVMIQMKINMRSLLSNDKAADDLNFNLGGIMGIRFTIWIWLSFVAFIVAAFLNYIRDKIALKEAMESAIEFEFQQKQIS